MGPTTKAISVTGGITFDQLIAHFRVQALGLMAGGADYLLLETAQDTRNIKAGLIGIEEAFGAAGWRIPVAVSATIEATRTMLGGHDAEALAGSLLHSDLLYVGLDCATGPLRVGERTTVRGSGRFKGLTRAGECEAAAEVGRAQVKPSAQVLDVCLQAPARRELADMEAFLDRLIRLVKVPLMIDSTDAA